MTNIVRIRKPRHVWTSSHLPPEPSWPQQTEAFPQFCCDIPETNWILRLSRATPYDRIREPVAAQFAGRCARIWGSRMVNAGAAGSPPVAYPSTFVLTTARR